MDVHQHFCNQTLNDFRARYEDAQIAFQQTIAGLKASQDQQAQFLQSCDDHLKPYAHQVLTAINVHIEQLHQQHRAQMITLVNQWILDGIEGHQALEDNQEIYANKMAFREAFINAIRQTAEFQPSEHVFAAMDEFLIDEEVDESVVQLLNLLNIPDNDSYDSEDLDDEHFTDIDDY